MQSSRMIGHTEEPGASRRNMAFKTDPKQFAKHFKEIQDLLSCPESKKILSEVKGEDIVMFIGNTKSGKSTLVNYAIGNELQAVKKTIVPFTLRIEKVNDEEKGPVIGMESVSETTLPTVWTATKSGIKEKLVDAPGFEDNRGETQDIANAFYIKEIIRSAKSVKFVLITDIRDVTGDNISSFINFIDKIDTIFPETRVLHGGITIVFSKGDVQYSTRDISTLLKATILDQKKMMVSGKSLIQYFAYNENCITFFNVPASEGSISKTGFGLAVLDVIENVLVGIPRKELVNVKPGVSDKSKVFLLQLHSQFCNMADYLRMLEKVKEGFTRQSLAIYEMELIKEVSKMDETLIRLEKKVNEVVPQAGTVLSLSSLLSIIIDLGKVCDVQDLEVSNNMDVKLQFVEFLDETLGLSNALVYLEKFYGTIELIRNEINNARLLAATRLSKINAEEAEKQKRELKEKHEAEMREYARRIEVIEQENRHKANQQLMDMGVWDHLAQAGKKVWSEISSWF